MAEPMRTVLFTVEENGVTPAAPQFAGVQGDHEATRVIFRLPEAWTAAGYVYRIEYADGVQPPDTTDLLEAADGQIAVLLPEAWTRGGGVGDLRVAVALPGRAGAAETQLF